jgi:hypothetical protein
MCISTPKAPPPVQIPDPPQVQAPPAQPQEQDAAVVGARNAEQRRRLRAQAANNTLVTGGAGLTQPVNTGTKTLYGQ